jgi:hypothetical protein
MFSRDSSVGIATGYGLDGRDFIIGRDKTFSLLHSAQTFPSYKMATGIKKGVKLTTHRHLVPR